jgi:hypothetical protein
MNRSALENPFPDALIKTRKGAFGKDLSFVEAVHYIRRLNDAFDSAWTWKVVSHEVNGAEVVVHGYLEAAGQSKHAFGSSNITTNKTTGEIVSIGDDLKAAATDALKKACSLFGIGLALQGRESEPGRGDGDVDSSPSSQPRGEGAGHSGDAERSRLTAKQLKAIFAIGRVAQMTDTEIRKLSVQLFGIAPEFLSRVNASELIDRLKATA